MALDLKTNAAADILRVTGGTSGTPETFDSVWNWDDGGGSSAGDGDVPKDGGGTAKVNTFMTEIIATYMYTLEKSFQVGDASTLTYFQTQKESIFIVDSFVITVRTNATFKLGDKVGDWGVKGSCISMNATSSYNLLLGGTLLCYGSQLKQRDGVVNVQFNTGSVTILNSELSGGDSKQTSYYFNAGLSYIELNKVYFTTLQNPVFFKTPDIISNVHTHNSTYGIYARADVTVIGIQTTSVVRHIRTHGAGTELILINPVTEISTIEINTAGNTVTILNTFNHHITDSGGVGFENVTVTCTDIFSDEVFSVLTDASGDIVEQFIPIKQWIDTGEVLTEFTPHKFEYLAAGFRTWVNQAAIIAAATAWDIKMSDFPETENTYSGDTADGVTGTLTTPADGTKVLVGEDTFGVGGTSIVPSATNPNSTFVLDTAPAYGFDGSSETPSATIPLESVVLSGSGTYGVDGTGSTPSFVPDFPAVANTWEGDTVNGVDGTLTLISGAFVIEAAGSFGLGGVSVTPIYHVTTTAEVAAGVLFGPGSSLTGTFTTATPEAPLLSVVTGTNEVTVTIDGPDGATNNIRYKASNASDWVDAGNRLDDGPITVPDLDNNITYIFEAYSDVASSLSLGSIPVTVQLTDATAGFDYDPLISKAVALIAKYGRLITLVDKVTSIPDADEPWNVTAGTDNTTQVKAVITNYAEKEIDGQLIKQGDKRMTFAAQDGIDFLSFEAVRDNGQEYKMKIMNPIEPGGSAIVYIARLRK